MKLSERGYRKIKSYEGYGKHTPDGGCAAYQETINGKLDVPTIGYGCTRGVTMGLVWTSEQAEAALRDEIAIHEKRVSRLITVDLNQNQFDALVSFDFNCGGLTDATGNPTGVLRAVNGGKDVVAELKRWNKFGGRPAKALIARRHDEAALFLEAVEPATPSTMPQAATPAALPVTPVQAAVTAATVVGGASQAAPTVSLSQIPAIQDMSSQLVAFGQFIAANPLQAGAVIIVCAALMFAPQLAGSKS